MRWWSCFFPWRCSWYGYAGDANRDTASLKGIGAFAHTSKEGSLVSGVSAALTDEEAARRNLKPGDYFEYKGQRLRYDDRQPSGLGHDDYIDIYDKNHPPDKGVSAEQIARDRQVMAEGGIEGTGEGGSHPSAPSNSTYVGPSKPSGNVTDLGHEHGAPAEEEEAPVSQEPAPDNAALQSPVSKDQVNQIKAEAPDPDAADDNMLNAHSSAVASNPADKRVTKRINPDTGSERVTGESFVPGDAVHDELQDGIDPYHLSKLPALSQAIGRGQPFSFMYGSAPQEGGAEEWQGEQPTGESRQYEYQLSTPQERIEEGAPTQESQVMMMPMQLAAEGGPGARSISLEGFGSQQAIGNAQKIINGAGQAGIKVPYGAHNEPKFQKDLMGFLENQNNGYRGEGSGPVLNEAGQPHESFKPEAGYVPHLLTKPEAEFIHASLNVRPGKKKLTPGPAPSLREHAQWIRRVNEAYAGHQPGENTLLDRLDAKLPEVAVRRVRKNKLTGEKETYVSGHVPWSHSRGTLESTWRKYRLELIRHGMPEIGAPSMRTMEGAQLIHRPPVFRQHAGELQERGPAPIGENPEVGAPAGTPNTPPESGFLASDQPQTEQETGPAAQAAPELPPAQQQGIDFASPNIRDDMSFNTAKKALKGKEHANVRNYADRLENDMAAQYGYQPAKNTDTIGDYQQTAENTLMTPHIGQEQAHRRLVQALKGLHGAQKQVLSFRHNDNGQHYLYSLTFNHDKQEKVRELLDKQGIKYRTFEPNEKKQPVGVHIVDFDGSIEPKLTKLFKQGHIADAYNYRGDAELIGDENSRERAAQEYRRVLQEARDQNDPRDAGRGGLHGGEAWFEPYAREAEENFQRLRQLEEFEKQEVANDHREAGTDRDQIPPDQTRELKRLNRIGKGLVASDPSMAELDPRSNHAYILGQKQFPRSDMRNADVGEFFDKEHPTLDLINNAKDRETAADIYFQDLIHSLAGTAHGGKPSTAYGWYDRTVRKTIKKMASVAPEILEDPDHELAFKLALAITSQGQEVNPNAESSWHAYQYWKKHGKFPEDVRNFGDGQKYVQMENNFKKINELWNGTEDKPGMSTAELRNLLTEKTTVGKLKENHGLTVAGENIGHVVRGAMGLGPKVGAFFSNLMGHFDPVTMDMWWSRDFNKIAGNMFNFSEDTMKKGGDKYGPQIEELAKMLGMESESKHPKLEGLSQMPALTPPGEGEGHVPRHEGFLAASPEEMEKMRDEIRALRAIPAGKMDRPNVLAAAPSIYQWAKKATRNYARSYGEEEGDRKRSFHPDFKTPENSLGKRMWENVNKLKDDPRGAAERNAWRQVTSLVEKKLQAHGIKLTNADKQALGWFNIKDVFALAGANAVRNADYLDAAYTLTRRIKNGDLPDLRDA